MFLKLLSAVVLMILSSCVIAEVNTKVSIDGGGIYLNDVNLNENIIKASTYSYRVAEENDNGTLKVVKYTFLSSTNQSCVLNMKKQDDSIKLNEIICGNTLYDKEYDKFDLYMYVYTYNGLDLKEFDEIPSKEIFVSKYSQSSNEFTDVPVMDKTGKRLDKNMQCNMKVRLMKNGNFDFYIETAKCKKNS